MSVFVAGFDIEGIGETTVEKLVAAGFNTLNALLNMTVEQASAVYGFAEIHANTARFNRKHAFVRYFVNPRPF